MFLPKSGSLFGSFASLPTGAFLVDRHVMDSACCSVCNSDDNSANHILFDCPFARAMWNIFGAFFPSVHGIGRAVGFVSPYATRI